MSDLDKIIEAWERCEKCNISVIADPEGRKAYLDCEYTIGLYCGQDKLVFETRELLKKLKEQKTVKPKENGFSIPATIIFNYECECGGPVMREQPHCMKCGKELLWE